MSTESLPEAGVASGSRPGSLVGGNGDDPDVDTRHDRFSRERSQDVDRYNDRRRSRSPGTAPYQRRGGNDYRDTGYGRRGGYGNSYRASSRGRGYDRYNASAELDALALKTELYAEDSPLSFGDFVRAVGNDFDPKLVAEKYDDYRFAFHTRQVQIFFKNSKNYSWFRERYHPDLLKERKLAVAETYKLNLALFQTDFQSGKLNGISLDENIVPAGGDDNDAAAVDMEDGEAAPRPAGDANPLTTTSLDTALRTPLADTTVEQLRQYPNMLVFKHLTSSIDRKMVQTVAEQDPDFAYLTLAEPNATRRFNRIGWMALKDGADTQQAYERMKSSKLMLPSAKPPAAPADDSAAADAAMDVDTAPGGDQYEFELHIAVFEPDTRTRLTAEIASLPWRIRHDLIQVRRIVDRFDKEFSFENPLHAAQGDAALDATDAFLRSPALLDASFKARDLEAYDLQAVKQTLDLYLVYLRRVYYFDYYSGRERADSAEEFIRRCGNHHFRRLLRSTTTEENALGRNWARRLDDVVETMLKGVDYNTLRKLGYKSIESEMELFVDKHVQRVDEQKFRCKVGECTKLFKGPEFVRKHIANKHSTELKEREADVEFFNNYVCDGFKLTVADQYRGQPPPTLSAPSSDYRRSGNGTSAGPTGRGRQVSYVDLDAPTTTFEDIQYL